MDVCVRVCLHKCTYATTFATSKHNCWHKAEGARTCRCKMANFSRRELDSFYTFCSPSLVPPFNPTYPPFLFLPYSSPNFLSHDFFSLLLFLCSCRSSSLPFARLEKRQDLPDVSLEEFKTKINRTTKKEGWFHASWKFVERKIKGLWWERWLTVAFSLFFFL